MQKCQVYVFRDNQMLTFDISSFLRTQIAGIVNLFLFYEILLTRYKPSVAITCKYAVVNIYTDRNYNASTHIRSEFPTPQE